jgi:hypothetical protein
MGSSLEYTSPTAQSDGERAFLPVLHWMDGLEGEDLSITPRTDIGTLQKELKQTECGGLFSTVRREWDRTGSLSKAF